MIIWTSKADGESRPAVDDDLARMARHLQLPVEEIEARLERGFIVEGSFSYLKQESPTGGD